MANYDAIVIGGGHNGLVAAAYMAKAGWRTLVLERNDTLGGAIRSSGNLTRPGFVHDVYSTNQNLFLASPFYNEFKDDLERHGLSFVGTDKPYCNIFPDGNSIRVYSDYDKTVAGIRAHNQYDGAGFATLYEKYQAFSKSLLPLLNTPLPSPEAAQKLTAAVREVGLGTLIELARLILHSTRELGDAYFETREMKALMATWGMHLDFGPDVASGTMFPLLETYADMEEGINITKGGASHIPEAIAGVIREQGGEVRTGAEVERILIKGMRVIGVELTSGEHIHAQHAIVANLAPTVLFDRLLGAVPVPDNLRQKTAHYQYGPATMMVHLVLDRPVEWAAGEEISEFGYVHIAPYVEDLAETYTDAVNGYLPKSPLLIVGQTTAVDPSRTPNDEHILWIQVRALPREIRGDAAGEIEGTNWDEIKEAYTERVIDKLATYAPSIRDSIIERAVLSPLDLERSNPNLVGGDSVGGSHHLFQNFLFRPFLGSSRYKMPMENLYMVGASTWPGAGNNAASGKLGAEQALQDHAVQRALNPLTVGGTVAGLGLLTMLFRRWRRG